MTKTAGDLVADARSRVPSIAPDDAHAQAASGAALILDVREPGELAASGTPHGAVHVPRGLLEFKADRGETGDAALKSAHTEGRSVMVLCASGGRAALAAGTLTDMGYRAQIIEGGMQGWKAAGLETKTV